MGKPDFQFKKRLKDLKRQKKQEEKRHRKLDKNKIGAKESPDPSPDKKENI